MIRRGALLLVAAALIAPGIATVAAPSPGRADTALDLAVTIDSLAPQVITADGALVVTGRLGNGSPEAFDAVSVRLRLGSWPLTSRDQIAAVVDGRADGEDSPLEPGQLDGVIVTASTTAVVDRLDSGGAASFRIGIPVSDLTLPTAGVYVLSVEAVSVGASTYDVIPRGVTRTLLPWMPDPVERTQVAWLWPLAAQPAQDSDGVMVTTSIPDDLATGGRLRRLLDAGTSSDLPLSWIVDPQVLDAADSMTRGYRVNIDGEITAGTDVQSATTWLAQLRSTVVPPGPQGGTAAVRVVPYADIDVAAVQRGGLDRDVVRAISLAPSVTRRVLGRDPRQTIEWAPGGNLDLSALDLLSSSGVTTVVMSADDVPPDPPVTFTPSGSALLPTSTGSIRAVLRDSGLAAVLDSPAASSEQVLLQRQRFLAETAMVTLELPSSPRTIVAAPTSLRWNPSPALLASILDVASRAPWIAGVPFESIADVAVSTVPRRKADYGAADRAAELPRTTIERTEAVQSRLASLAGVLSQPIPVVEPVSVALLRAQSAAWRDNPQLGDAVLRQTSSAVQADIDAVRILSRSTVTLSGESGVIPVTIANDLDQDIVVTLRLTATPSARLTSEPIRDVVLPAGRKTSIEVEARVVGGGPVPVTAELISANGQRFGEAVSFELRSTVYARTAGWVIGGALAVLAAFVVIGVVRRIRQPQPPRHASRPTAVR